MDHRKDSFNVPCPTAGIPRCGRERAGDIEEDNFNKWISRDVSSTARFRLIISFCGNNDFRPRIINTFNFDPAVD